MQLLKIILHFGSCDYSYIIEKKTAFFLWLASGIRNDIIAGCKKQSCRKFFSKLIKTLYSPQILVNCQPRDNINIVPHRADVLLK